MKCDRCGTEFQDVYCPACQSCQHCPCCPCYKVGCEYCEVGGIREGESRKDYEARRETAWAEE